MLSSYDDKIIIIFAIQFLQFAKDLPRYANEESHMLN